jgi:hypothetical protein
MKTTICNLVLGAALAVSAGGCVTVQGGNGAAAGMIYSGYKMGGNVGTGTGGSKTGQSCATSILSLAAIGDASLEAAKKAGGITTVSDVDHDIFSVLGIYGKTCTIVHGD